MLSWHVRRTGTRRQPPERRLAWAGAIASVWFVVGVWLTFAFDWQLGEVWAWLGLYGDVDPARRSERFAMFRYEPEHVVLVNHRIEVWGNYLLFTPLAVIVLLVRPRTRWWQLGLFAAALSGLVEVGQRVAGGRTPELADVATNTSGALLAFAAAVTVRAAYRAVRSRRGRAGAPVGASEATAAPTPTAPPPPQPAPSGRP